MDATRKAIGVQSRASCKIDTVVLKNSFTMFFSEREIRALAVFLPLAALLVAGVLLVRPKADPEVARQVEQHMQSRADTVRLAPFDPNTADRDELLRLGLTNFEAVSLLKYRAAGD